MPVTKASKPPLVLGTAEFNPKGYNNVITGEKEVSRILGLAREAGITLLDTAESYNCHSLIKKHGKGFCIYNKTRDWKVNLDWGSNELRGLLYHYGFKEKPVELPHIHRWLNLGVSVYTPDQLPENTSRIIQVPLNIVDNDFDGVFGLYRTVFVRSVFKRGELLKTYSVRNCLDFVKSFRPDGIIVGVKTAKELSLILKNY